MPRLVAIGNSRFNGTQFNPTDSSAIFYSGTRGGDLKNQLKYDSGYIYTYNASSGYTNASKLYQTFDAGNNLRSRTTAVAAGSVFTNSTRILNTHTADGQIRTVVNQQWSAPLGAWVNVDSTFYDYNASGYRVLTGFYQWQGGAWVGASQEIKHYTLGPFLDTNRVQYAQNGVWRDSLQDVYVYDADTFLLKKVRKLAKNAVFTDTLQTLYSNNAQGDPLLETNQRWAGGWINVSQRVAAYTPANQTTTSLVKSWNGSLAKWDTVSNALFAYNATGNVESEVDQVWNAVSASLVNSKRFRYAYNATAQVVTTLRDTWDPVGQSWNYNVADQISRYRYEEILGVGQIAADDAITIAPNPASARFTITTRLRGSAVVSVLDLAGRTLQTQPLNAGGVRTVVETDRLEPGLYLVRVSGAGQDYAAHLLIVR